MLTEDVWGRKIRQEADGRLPNDKGSTLHTATPLAQLTASCEELKGLHEREDMSFCDEWRMMTGAVDELEKTSTESSLVATASLDVCGCQARHRTELVVQSLVREKAATGSGQLGKT